MIGGGNSLALGAPEQLLLREGRCVRLRPAKDDKDMLHGRWSMHKVVIRPDDVQGASSPRRTLNLDGEMRNGGRLRKEDLDKDNLC